MWYLTLHRLTAPRETADQFLEEHLAWIFHHHQQGNVLFSGPTTDHQVGIIVLQAPSLEEARKILASEPYSAHQVKTYEIFEWDVRQILGTGGFTPATVAAIRRDRDILGQSS